MTNEELNKIKNLQNEIKKLRGLKKVLRRNFQDMVGLLTVTISQTNTFLGGHLRRTALICKSFCEYMRYDKDTVYRIYYGALLHDIGMVGMPEKIINTPSEQLSEADFIFFKRHPVIGEKMILSAYDLRQTAKIVRSHHEDFGGDGFPDRLAGSEIPIGARITRLANDYDNLIYKNKIKAKQAAETLKERAGYIYDPKLTPYFIKFIEENVTLKDKETKPAGIKIKDLKIGMYTAEDIMLSNGMLLIPKGIILDSAMLEKIQSFDTLLDTERVVSILR
ncbi:MAG: HD domain-containing protein [Spirochaetales bacterium]|nr:HD domain-containing protein [Spirochaetales bacterium]